MMRRFLRIGALRVAGLVGLSLVLGGPRVALAGQTYLALGDSVTFGVQADDSTGDISKGDRGYVGGYASYLGRLTGTRPKLLNLAVSGETTSSFLGQRVGLNGPDAAARNTNYPTPLVSQFALMTTMITAEQNAGNTISTVTMTLGANDLFLALAVGTPFPQVFATFQANEVAILTQIRSLLPSTNLTLLGYYDPYAPYLNLDGNPLQPLAQVSSVAIPLINSMIAADAQQFGARFVDLYPVFQGKEFSDTYIQMGGNVHPNDAGYALITAALVPEPSSVLMVVLGVGVVPVLHRPSRGRGVRATAAA